jgi:hypothetical protein
MQKPPLNANANLLGSYEITGVICASAAILAAYMFVWRDFLTATMLFGDFGLSLPGILDQYFWVHSNGWAVQWFTPGMCGGIPSFPEPQSGQYSLLILLAYFLGPTASVKVAFLVHAWLGFVGAYALCRRGYGLAWEASLIAATLFMFNGFYAYRILVSHLFYGLMLTPLLALCLLNAFNQTGWIRAMTSTVIAALVFTVYLYSGGLGMVFPFCGGVVLLIALAFTRNSSTPSIVNMARSSVVFVAISMALIGPKLVAASSFLELFPRDGYRLPGFSSILEMLKSLWLMFFLSPHDAVADILAHVSNMQWLLDRHEWEFGVTLVPVVLVLLVLYKPAVLRTRMRTAAMLWWLPILLLLLAPVAFNYYTPQWSLFLKSIPIVKSSSNMVRYFWIWVVFLCFWPVVFFDAHNWFAPARRKWVALACISLVVLTFASQNKDYYRIGSTYDPADVEKAFQKVANGEMQPRIRSIGVLTDAQGNLLVSGDRNKVLAEGISQLFCYQPIFGYGLEKFPFGSMRAGDPFEEVAPGQLNFKNPACMVYPQANHCEVGASFTTAQKASLDSFLGYGPYEFALSQRQISANTVAAWAALLLVVFLGVRLIGWLRSTARRHP